MEYLSGMDCSAQIFQSKTGLPHDLVGWGASRGWSHCAIHTYLRAINYIKSMALAEDGINVGIAKDEVVCHPHRFAE